VIARARFNGASSGRIPFLMGLLLTLHLVPGPTGPCASAAQAVRSAADLARVAFVTNRGSHDLAVLGVQPNGVLRGPAGLVSMPDELRGPAAAVLGPGGEHLYVGSWGSHAIAIFRLDSFGSPVAVGSVPHPPETGSNTSGLAISPDGRFLFAASYNDGTEGSVATFAIGADGGLSAVGEPATTGGLGPVGVKLSPDGRALYVANMTSGTISVMGVDGDGGLTLNQTVTSGTGTFALAFSASDRQLYVVNALDATVSMYGIDSVGRLNELAPAVSSGAQEPRGIVLSPDGKYVYVAHFNGGSGAGSVTAFKVNANGTLNRHGLPAPTGGRGAGGLAARGLRLYVANANQRSQAGSVAAMTIGSDGSLDRRDALVSTRGQSPDWGGLVLWPPAPEARSP
jgi:6-phosphogluconolactonase (cycloisomerase 2 family)